MTVACDLDGVLVDTHEALVRAYDAVGATWVPDRPWREWCTPEQHAKKIAIYQRFFDVHARLTKFGRYVYRTEWVVLTGAGPDAVRLIDLAFGLPLPHVVTGLSPEEKADLIHRKGIAVYFDDSQAAIDIIKRGAPNCQTVLVQPR